MISDFQQWHDNINTQKTGPKLTNIEYETHVLDFPIVWTDRTVLNTHAHQNKSMRVKKRVFVVSRRIGQSQRPVS